MPSCLFFRKSVVPIFAFSLLFLSGCAGSVRDTQDTQKFSLETRDWINPQIEDIHAHVNVEKIAPQLFSLQYSFKVPLDPVSGVSPSAFHFFTFCLAAHLSANNGYSRLALGTKIADLKYKNTTSVELFVAALQEKEEPETLNGAGSINWIMKNTNNSFNDMCGRIIRTKYLWNKKN